MNVMRMMG